MASFGAILGVLHGSLLRVAVLVVQVLVGVRDGDDTGSVADDRVLFPHGIPGKLLQVPNDELPPRHREQQHRTVHPELHRGSQRRGGAYAGAARASGPILGRFHTGQPDTRIPQVGAILSAR